MRIVVLFFPSRQQEKLLRISRALAKGIEAQGHQVDVLNGSKGDDIRLSHYQYILVGVDFPSIFNSRLPQAVAQRLKNAGILAGKRSSAFILPKLIGAGKSLRNLMSIMEGEGMFIKYSEIIGDERLAQSVGKKLILSK